LNSDGGGIKGFSSLVILRTIMEKVKELEMQQDARSSYDPEDNPGCINHPRPSISLTQSRRPSVFRKKSTVSSTVRETPKCHCAYLPCHYFDYIGGTSTGG
jgi:hypothetical protein